MKIYYLLSFLLLPISLFSQIKGVTINSETNASIPYTNVWVMGENIGTTADENGAFILPPLDSIQTIVFSSVGYETLKISSDSLTSEIALSPTIFQLEHVVVRASKQNRETIIGTIKKTKVKSFFACGDLPWMSARFYPYLPNYKQTPFLKKIALLTDSNIKDAIFKVRLYGVNEKGMPEGYIYPKDLYGIAKKGKKVTEVDFSSLNIPFPENGFFIAIEWLIIPANKYEYTYTSVGSRQKKRGVHYHPSIGTIPSETAENSWVFIGGGWVKPLKDLVPSKNYRDKYSLVAMELTLTN